MSARVSLFWGRKVTYSLIFRNDPGILRTLKSYLRSCALAELFIARKKRLRAVNNWQKNDAEFSASFGIESKACDSMNTALSNSLFLPYRPRLAHKYKPGYDRRGYYLHG